MDDINAPEPLLPSIIGLEGITDPATKRFALAVKEILETRQGTRPNASFLDKGLTYRDLYKYNLASLVVNGQILTNPNPNTGVVVPNTGTSSGGSTETPTVEVDLSIPGAPLGLIASGTKLAVLLEWDAAATSVAYAEIHRSNTDNLGQAVLIGTAAGSLYADILGETNLTRYYWIRFVSKSGVFSDFNSINGTEAITGRLGSGDLISVDGAKIIDATILDAKIGTVSADKIRTGTLQVGQAIQVGDAQNRIFIDGTGIIRSGGMLDYANGSGFWQGVTGGVVKWSVGNSSKFARWDGNNIFIQGNNFSLTDSELYFNGNGTFNGNGNFSGNLIAANGTFAGALQAATGSFSGQLNAATGSFGGQLLAGVIDFAALAGVTYVYIVPGTYIITVPADKTTLRVAIAGGGGGGAASGGNNNNNNGAGGGGGGSNMVVSTFTNLTPGATYTLVVGAGGRGAQFTPIVISRNGGDGETSSIAGLITSQGGQGGFMGGSTAGANGAGGLGRNGANDGGVGSGYLTGTITVGSLGQPGTSTPAVPPRRGLGGLTTNGGASGGSGGEGAIDVNPPRNVGGYAAVSGLPGENGRAIIEFFNPNSVVIRTDYNILLSALTRQGIQIV